MATATLTSRSAGDHSVCTRWSTFAGPPVHLPAQRAASPPCSMIIAHGFNAHVPDVDGSYAVAGRYSNQPVYSRMPFLDRHLWFSKPKNRWHLTLEAASSKANVFAHSATRGTSGACSVSHQHNPQSPTQSLPSTLRGWSMPRSQPPLSGFRMSSPSTSPVTDATHSYPCHIHETKTFVSCFNLMGTHCISTCVVTLGGGACTRSFYNLCPV